MPNTRAGVIFHIPISGERMLRAAAGIPPVPRAENQAARSCSPVNPAQILASALVLWLFLGASSRGGIGDLSPWLQIGQISSGIQQWFWGKAEPRQLGEPWGARGAASAQAGWEEEEEEPSPPAGASLPGVCSQKGLTLLYLLPEPNQQPGKGW